MKATVRAFVLSACLSSMLAACGSPSGRIGDLPAISNSASASTVTVVRVSSVIGAANGYIVALDGKDLLGIGSGQHAGFQVPAGEHYISAKCFGGMAPTWKEDSVRFTAAAGAQNYFIITPSGSCAEIKLAGEADVRPHLGSSKPVDLDKTVPR